jgi:hypothetical protein
MINGPRLNRRLGSRLFFAAALSLFSATAFGCSRNHNNGNRDQPRITSDVSLQDVTFHSSALNRDVQYRVFLPKTFPSPQPSCDLSLAWRWFSRLVELFRCCKVRQASVLLVMPEGNSSYYTNSATVPSDRFEDYIVKDLRADVETRVSAAATRNKCNCGRFNGWIWRAKDCTQVPESLRFCRRIEPSRRRTNSSLLCKANRAVEVS